MLAFGLYFVPNSILNNKLTAQQVENETVETAWTRIKQQVRDRELELQQTFGKACEFQQELIEILEWISLQQEKFINLDSSFTSSDPKTIRFQINLLKVEFFNYYFLK